MFVSAGLCDDGSYRTSIIFRLAACNLGRVSGSARHDGPGEGRNGGNGALRRIGLILADDPKGLFAATA